MLKAGVFGTSSKESEKRIPIHPEMLAGVDENIKPYLYFEAGYAAEFGLSEEYLIKNFGGVLPRDELFHFTDVWILPKPSKNDFKFFKKGKLLWGWPHCVQGAEITQALIDNEMTVISWEAMYGGSDNVHAFQKNNEIAGYAAVHHMMMLTGKNGYFGGNLKAAVLGYGSTGKGAVHALQGLGIHDVDVFTKRAPHLIAGSPMGVSIGNISQNGATTLLTLNNKCDSASKILGEYNIIVNCVLQDPLSPINFVSETEINDLHSVDNIIDVSCDEGMGFYFAKPTTMNNPVFEVNNTKIKYYSVDHTPTIYWDASSYQISKVVLYYISDILSSAWNKNEVLNNAAEIIDGKIKNNKIIKFQNREADFPYKVK